MNANVDHGPGISRRRLLAASVAGAASLGWPGAVRADDGGGPVFVATWPHGQPAVEAAARTLSEGKGSVLDSVIAGAQVPEIDPDVTSVGKGGWPNEAGVVQLDASVMDGTTRRVGAVGALERVATAAAVARRVMEATRHAFLVGAGALEFARAQGFEETDLLTERARAAWEAWKAGREAARGGGDTIGLVGLSGGRMAGACTTSGLAWKMPGRVGDSPIIGAGLYVDDRAGAATATGVGEEVIRVCGSFLVVERMRAGDDPQTAVETALARIAENAGRTVQVGMLALDRSGRVGAASLQPGFRYALWRDGRSTLVDARVL